jgi:hypothetical protein
MAMTSAIPPQISELIAEFQFPVARGSTGEPDTSTI